MAFFLSCRLVSGPCRIPLPTPTSAGGTHVLLGILLCPGSLSVVAELACAVQHAWGSLPEVGDQVYLLPGLVPRHDCRGERRVIRAKPGPPTLYHQDHGGPELKNETFSINSGAARCNSRIH